VLAPDIAAAELLVRDGVFADLWTRFGDA
jgi:hypothetical protein